MLLRRSMHFIRRPQQFLNVAFYGCFAEHEVTVASGTNFYVMEARHDDTRLTTCTRCRNDFNDPRLLPCSHTICNPCIQFCVDRDSGTGVCPLCRKHFVIPTGQLLDLPKNFSLEAVLAEKRKVNFRYQAAICVLMAIIVGMYLGSDSNKGLVKQIESLEREAKALNDRNRQLQDNLVTSHTAQTKQMMEEISELKRVLEEEKEDSLTKETELYRQVNRLWAQIQHHGSPKSIKLEGSLSLSSSYDHVIVVTLGKELFALNPETSNVNVYDTITFRNKRQINLGLTTLYNVARNSLCNDNRHLYISTTNNLILKVDVNGQVVAKWSTGNIKGRPSLTHECNVVFTPHDYKPRLFIYSPDGDLIHKIQLKMDIGGARLNCAVQLPNGKFVVSYGTDSDTQHGLSLVDSEGNVLRSFGGERGKSVGQVNGTYDFDVDRFGRVIVVDHNNHRMLLLSPSLNYLYDLLSAEGGLRFPNGVILDEVHGRLFLIGNAWDKINAVIKPEKIMIYNLQL